MSKPAVSSTEHVDGQRRVQVRPHNHRSSASFGTGGQLTISNERQRIPGHLIAPAVSGQLAGRSAKGGRREKDESLSMCGESGQTLVLVAALLVVLLGFAALRHRCGEPIRRAAAHAERGRRGCSWPGAEELCSGQRRKCCDSHGATDYATTNGATVGNPCFHSQIGSSKPCLHHGYHREDLWHVPRGGSGANVG